MTWQTWIHWNQFWSWSRRVKHCRTKRDKVNPETGQRTGKENIRSVHSYTSRDICNFERWQNVSIDDGTDCLMMERFSERRNMAFHKRRSNPVSWLFHVYSWRSRDIYNSEGWQNVFRDDHADSVMTERITVMLQYGMEKSTCEFRHCTPRRFVFETKTTIKKSVLWYQNFTASNGKRK